jgi:hypothetical protein
MLYIALTVVLKAKDKPARIFSYILSGILVLVVVILLYTRNSVQNYQEELEEKKEERMPTANLGMDGYWVFDGNWEAVSSRQ